MVRCDDLRVVVRSGDSKELQKRSKKQTDASSDQAKEQGFQDKCAENAPPLKSEGSERANFTGAVRHMFRSVVITLSFDIIP